MKLLTSCDPAPHQRHHLLLQDEEQQVQSDGAKATTATSSDNQQQQTSPCSINANYDHDDHMQINDATMNTNVSGLRNTSEHSEVVDGVVKLLSPIAQFYNKRIIFITGSSGFMGKVLLEKLLRTYTGISHIYLLLRTKRNTSPHERLNNGIFNVPLFDTIKRLDGKLLNKVSVIPGDISLPRLGMSEEDEQKLIDANVSVIFHSAATVKFDEPLKRSVALNLIAARNMIVFARKLPNLVSLCHVSTAYANSDIRGCEIEERVYPMLDEPRRIIEMAQWMDEDTMQTLKAKLLRNKPNTYTYTKALAELLLLQEAQDLPVTIVRPSIVVATWREPIRGWVDNLNGPTGLMLAIGKGLLRTLHVKRNAVADVIPADICINLMIAAAWKSANEYASAKSGQLAVGVTNGNIDSSSSSSSSSSKGKSGSNNINNKLSVAITKDGHHNHSGGSQAAQRSQDQKEKEEEEHYDCDTMLNQTKAKEIVNFAPKSSNLSSSNRSSLPVYHCTSGKLNPITWGSMEPLFLPIIRQYPSCQVLRYPGGTFKENALIDSFFRLFVHYFPALLVDMLCFCTGNKRILLNIYDKIHGAISQLKVFCTTEWSFKNDNIMALYENLDPRDQETLPMDIRKVHWESFWHDYTLGSRTYVLKEDPKTLTQARKSLNRAYYLDMGLTMLMMLAIWYFLGSPIMNICNKMFDGLSSNNSQQSASATIADNIHKSTSNIWSKASSAFTDELFPLGSSGGGSSSSQRPLRNIRVI